MSDEPTIQTFALSARGVAAISSGCERFAEEAEVTRYVGWARGRIATLTAERDEADRRAGAAEREMASLKEEARKRRWWLDSAKEARGYGMYVTFDRVWAETCAKADEAAGLRQQNEALQEALHRASQRAQEAQ